MQRRRQRRRPDRPASASALLVNIAATLFGAGVALRTQDVQAGPLMQMPVFVLLFLAPVYVPLALLTGWIHTVASYNPVTALIDAGPRLHLRRAGQEPARVRVRLRRWSR